MSSNGPPAGRFSKDTRTRLFLSWAFLFPILVIACSGGRNVSEKPLAGLVPFDDSFPCPTFESAAEGLPEDEDWRFHIALGDVNQDGFLDLGAIPRKGSGPRVFLFDGKRRWKESSDGLDFRGFSCGGGGVFADLNGDDNLDFFVADHCSGLYLYIGDGQGGWTPSRDSISGKSSRMGMNDMAVGDLNLDGILDVVAVTAFSRGFRVFRGEENGGWTEWKTNLPSTGGGYRVKLRDLDSDGRLDILNSLQVYSSHSSSSTGQRNSPVWFNSEDGIWRPGGVFPDQFRAWDIHVRKSTKGKSWDLLLTGIGKGGGVRSIHWDPWTKTLAKDYSAWILPEGQEYSSTGLAIGDFLGNGLLDLALARYRQQRVDLFLATGGGVWKECPRKTLDLGTVTSPVWGLNSADLNGDGFLDLTAVQGTEGGGKIQVWIQKR